MYHLAQQQGVHACDTLHVVSLLFFEHHRDHVILVTEWVCRWKTFWIPSGDTFQKAYLEEWQRVNDEQSHDLGEDKPQPISSTTESAKLQKTGRDDSNTKREQLCDVPSLPKSSFVASSWRIRRTIMEIYGDSGKCCSFGNHWVLHCSSSKTAFAIIFIQNSSVLLSSDWYCRILTKRSYPGMRKDVSSTRDGFSAWVNTDFVTTLTRHTVDVKSVSAAFRDAPSRRHSTSCQEYHFNNDMPNRLTEPKEGAYRKTNCGEVAHHHLARSN